MHEWKFDFGFGKKLILVQLWQYNIVSSTFIAFYKKTAR